MEGLFDKKYFPSLLKCLMNIQEQSVKKNWNLDLEHVGYAH